MGKLRFGIKKGELRLNLTNCQMPPDTRTLGGQLDLAIAVKRNNKTGTETQSSLKGTMDLEKRGAEASRSYKNNHETQDEFHWTVHQVTQKGSSEMPAWVFEATTGAPFLKGELQGVKLGTLQIDQQPWNLTGTFEVELKDVHLTQLEGIWLRDLIPAKRVVLDRIIALHILKNVLQPYLCKIESN
jgi:hypothetical protein